MSRTFLINLSWQLCEKPPNSSDHQLIAATTLSNITRLQVNVNDKNKTFFIYLRNMNNHQRNYLLIKEILNFLATFKNKSSFFQIEPSCKKANSDLPRLWIIRRPLLHQSINYYRCCRLYLKRINCMDATPPLMAFVRSIDPTIRLKIT